MHTFTLKDRFFGSATLVASLLLLIVGNVVNAHESQDQLLEPQSLNSNEWITRVEVEAVEERIEAKSQNAFAEEGAIAEEVLLEKVIVQEELIPDINEVVVVEEVIPNPELRPVVDRAFGSRPQPTDALSFVTGLYNLRMQVILQMDRVGTLLHATRRFLDSEVPEEQSELYSDVEKKVTELERQLERNRLYMGQYLSKEAFLRRALVEKYDLYSSFFSRIIGRPAARKQQENLVKMGEKVSGLEDELRTLYIESRVPPSSPEHFAIFGESPVGLEAATSQNN